MTEKVKIGLAAASLITIIVGAALAALRKRSGENEAARAFLETTPIVRLGRWSFNVYQTFVGALLLVTVFGSVNYMAYGSHLHSRRFDSYDLLHYYVAPKYFDELGYFRLLPALIIADAEEGRTCEAKTRRYLYQDETDYEFKPIEHALDREAEIKSHFTKERWAEFVGDVVYLQRDSGNLGCALWRELLQDHGFNGTPSWVLVARPIVDLIPVEWMKVASSLDLVLIIAMLVAVLWAFGAETTLFAWLFVTLCYSFRWPIITWSFLRYDWLSAMVIGLCMLRKEKHVAAGAFFGYAAAMRYFPALWMFGIVAKGAHSVVTLAVARRPLFKDGVWLGIPTIYLRMAAGFALAVTLLVGASTARYGTLAHETSFENIFAHIQPHNLSSRRMGLVIAAVYEGETEQNLITADKKAAVERIEGKVRVFSIAMMLLLGLFLSRTKDWEAVGLGLIPYFWLTTSSYYYYALRLTGIVVHASDLAKPRNAVGLLLLFAMELFCNASEHLNPGNRYFLVSVLCVMMAIYTFSQVAFLGWEWWQARGPRPGPAEDPAIAPPKAA
jgi:hypothetical protein